MSSQRLSKVLAAAGIASRRKCEEIIFEGKVTVNGEIVRIPQTMVDILSDEIQVEGEPVKSSKNKLYYLINKPKGYLCSNKRRQQEKLVIDLIHVGSERLYTVGRLDKNTTGLLLITNDGHFANRVMHPSSNITREYLVKTNKDITPEHLKIIGEGTYVEGAFVTPLRVKKVRKGTLKVTVGEGRKREVRILVQRARLKVIELTRIRIGGLTLGSLPIGKYRMLTEDDIEAIFS